MMKLSDPFNQSSLDHNDYGNHMEKNLTFDYETNDDQINPIVKTYPWLLEFRKLCISELLNKSMESLTKLTKFYIKNVTKAVKDCYGRPKRAAKLKMEMSNTLTFFYYVYREVKTPLEHSLYLENISDLMAMYIDMEIKASRNGIESIRKVASMITSSLKLYFDNFPNYILDTILKTNIITKRHRDLGDLIFRWVLRDFPESPVDIITYVRYILVFKMWKEIMQESKEQQLQIVELACIKLQPPIGLKERLESNQTLQGLFPIIPSSDITKFLMKAKFSSRKKAEVFFKALADPMVMAFLNYPISPINDDIDTLSVEQGKNPVDRILNDIWSDLNNGKKVNSKVLTQPSKQVLKNSKYKRKMRGIGSKIKSEIKKKRMQNIFLGEDDKYTIELKMGGTSMNSRIESEIGENLLQNLLLFGDELEIEDTYHSMEYFSDSVEENKDDTCKLETKKHEMNNVIKEKKSEDLNSSEFCGISDHEDDMCCKLETKKEEISYVTKEPKSEDYSSECCEKSDHEEETFLPPKKRRRYNLELEEEEKITIFKTPAQLKAFTDLNDPINIALGSRFKLSLKQKKIEQIFIYSFIHFSNYSVFGYYTCYS